MSSLWSPADLILSVVFLSQPPECSDNCVAAPFCDCCVFTLDVGRIQSPEAASSLTGSRTPPSSGWLMGCSLFHAIFDEGKTDVTKCDRCQAGPGVRGPECPLPAPRRAGLTSDDTWLCSALALTPTTENWWIPRTGLAGASVTVGDIFLPPAVLAHSKWAEVDSAARGITGAWEPSATGSGVVGSRPASCPCTRQLAGGYDWLDCGSPGSCRIFILASGVGSGSIVVTPLAVNVVITDHSTVGAGDRQDCLTD